MRDENLTLAFCAYMGITRVMFERYPNLYAREYDVFKAGYRLPRAVLSDERIDAIAAKHLGPSNIDAHRQFARALESAGE